MHDKSIARICDIYYDQIQNVVWNSFCKINVINYLLLSTYERNVLNSKRPLVLQHCFSYYVQFLFRQDTEQIPLFVCKLFYG